MQSPNHTIIVNWKKRGFGCAKSCSYCNWRTSPFLPNGAQEQDAVSKFIAQCKKAFITISGGADPLYKIDENRDGLLTMIETIKAQGFHTRVITREISAIASLQGYVQQVSISVDQEVLSGIERHRPEWQGLEVEYSLVLPPLPQAQLMQLMPQYAHLQRRLYGALSQLVAPERLPLGRTAFHERTGLRTSAKVTVGGKREVPLLKRCRLRLKIVKTCLGDQTRTYLFGFEELTGYIAFHVISPAAPTLQAIAGFIREVEDHLALPVRRVLLINMAPPSDVKAKKVIGIEMEYQKTKRTTAKIISPYQRSAEIDLLHRLTKKQNNEMARVNAAAIRDAISSFVNQERLGGTRWETPAQRLVTRRLEAEADELRPYLSMRF